MTFLARSQIVGEEKPEAGNRKPEMYTSLLLLPDMTLKSLIITIFESL
jgi:hypothetical protein